MTAGALNPCQQESTIETRELTKGESMNSLSVSRSVLFPILALALAQFACGAAKSTPSGNLQIASTTDAQQTQAVPAATSEPTSERGTPAEAEAMLKLAVEHYQQFGRDQALADFNAKKAHFSTEISMLSA